MKTKSSIIYMIMLVSFLGFQSCSEDDSNDANDDFAGCNNFQADYTQITEAMSAYSQNPSPETCENYKDALLDFYASYNDCAFWGDDYQEAYDDILAIDCSEEGLD